MTHIIIYDNCAQQNGYGLERRSPGFPERYCAELAAVCSKFASRAGAEPAGVRWAPLQDRFLLSVVLRFPGGSAAQHRGHYSVVNFLLDGSDADHFFTLPLGRTLPAVIDHARNLYNNREKGLPDGLPFHTLASPSDLEQPPVVPLPGEVLLAGAFYAREVPMLHQLFLEDSAPAHQLQQLQRLLPCALRKDISFFSGLDDACESYGCALNFCSRSVMEHIQREEVLDSPSTTKYCAGAGEDPAAFLKDSGMLRRCRKILSALDSPCGETVRKSITGWDQLARLGEENSPDLLRLKDREQPPPPGKPHCRRRGGQRASGHSHIGPLMLLRRVLRPALPLSGVLGLGLLLFPGAQGDLAVRDAGVSVTICVQANPGAAALLGAFACGSIFAWGLLRRSRSKHKKTTA